MRIFFLIFAALVILPLQATPKDLLVYIGTYTQGDSEGIYTFRFDAETGRPGPVRLAAESLNPSFLALHPSGRVAYAVNEVSAFEGQASGAVSAYQIQDNGDLTFLNQLASGGGAPCHLVVDQTGKYLLVANYLGGNVGVFSLADDGRLAARTDLVQHIGSSVNRRRQNGPHAHSVNLDANNRFAAAADLGVDKVFVYPLDRDRGRLDASRARSVSLRAGAGPRHFAFHPNGQLAFVNSELHSELTSLRFDAATGDLTVLDSLSTLPPSAPGNSTAETQVHPNGRFVYVSNRGHNSIAVFAVDPSSGKLRLVEHESTGGKVPRNFSLDPSGRFLLAANQQSDSVVFFKVNSRSGALTPTGVTITVPTPVCVKFLERQ